MQFGGRGGSLAGDGRRIPLTFNGKLKIQKRNPRAKRRLVARPVVSGPCRQINKPIYEHGPGAACADQPINR